MEDDRNERQLTSWKEISQYLGRDIRTCWRWEKQYGLPIHRVDPESPKSRVYAFKDELDEWLRQETSNRITNRRSVSRRPSRKWLLFLAIMALAPLAVMLFLFSSRIMGPSEPADFQIEGSTLIILNNNGKELWRFDTQLKNLVDNQSYHTHFQSKETGGTENIVLHLPWICIEDINRDFRREVLFCTWTIDEHGGGDLFCFDSRGKELWKFKAGREMFCGTRPFGTHFNIRGFVLLDINGDGILEIAVISQQPPNWLTQFILLDSNGRILGEYWNSGHLSDCITEDLNGDGRKELLIAGLNNEYGKGCLIVFDPQNIAGGSPQTKAEYICRDVRPGSQKFYILFPRTDVDLELNAVESVTKIISEHPNILSLETAISGISFILDFNLAVRDVTFSHGFMQKHREARRAGKVQSSLDDPVYKEVLIQGILYYDGRRWTTQPTQVASGN